MLGSEYPQIHAQHIEAPTRRFLCEYHHAAYRPGGFPFTFPIETLPGLREAILASPPMFLQGVRHMLAETGPANVVRLSPRQSP